MFVLVILFLLCILLLYFWFYVKVLDFWMLEGFYGKEFIVFIYINV